MHDWEVVMGRWGTKYAGPDGKKARRAYRRAVEDALKQKALVSVALFKDGVSIREFDVEAYFRGMELS